ncbi:hypothetical protein DSUL_50448 [Desulfovibrionales bacterium]
MALFFYLHLTRYYIKFNLFYDSNIMSMVQIMFIYIYCTYIHS